MATLFDGSSVPQSPRAYTVYVGDAVMPDNTLTNCERSGEADKCRRLHAESVAAALQALAVLQSEGMELAAFLEADTASEQATKKWIEADRAARRRFNRDDGGLKSAVPMRAKGRSRRPTTSSKRVPARAPRGLLRLAARHD